MHPLIATHRTDLLALAHRRSSQGRVKLGSMLAAMGRRAKLTDDEFAVFEQVRSKASDLPIWSAPKSVPR
jgi:hypothetical protein